MRTHPLHLAAVVLAVLIAAGTLSAPTGLLAEETKKGAAIEGTKKGTATDTGISITPTTTLDPFKHKFADLTKKVKGMKLKAGSNLVYRMPSGTKISAIAKNGKIARWVIARKNGKVVATSAHKSEGACFLCWDDDDNPGEIYCVQIPCDDWDKTGVTESKIR